MSGPDFDDPRMDGTYIDSKNRRRWHCNDRLAEQLKQLHDFLVIGNYPESHAARYPRLAHFISRHPESILEIHKDNRLQELPGVSQIIAGIIGELIETGTCRKMHTADQDENYQPPPTSVLELTAIPRLGAKTAKMLYQDHGIESLESLAVAIQEGRLQQIKGIGPSMIAGIKSHIADQDP